MAEVSIRAHTRRGKGGKTVQVRSYNRRVGRKGVHSPKRGRSSGSEFEEKVEEKKTAPKMSAEELAAERKRVSDWENSFNRAEAERKSLGMTREQHSRHKLKQVNSSKSKVAESHTETIKNPLSPQGSLGILERVEDKIAKFVEKYSRRKYRRKL